MTEQTLRDQIAALIRRWHADRATVCDQTCTCGLRGTLRDQLAEAIRTTFAHAAAYDGTTDGRSVTWEQLADAVLPIVQAALAKARAEHGELWDQIHRGQHAAMAERERAEKAEATLAEAKAAFEHAVAITATDAMKHRLCGLELHSALRRAEQAEGAVQRVRALAEADHEVLPRHILAALDQPKDTP